MAVLPEPQVLVEEPLHPPQDHAHSEHDPRRGEEGGARGPVLPGGRGDGRGLAQPPLDQQEDAEDGEVLDGLEDRHREPPARLSGVVHPEPLVGRVPASGHHQLGTEEPADAPARHEHRGHEVGEAQGGQLWAPPPGADDGHRHGEEQPSERREPTLPDGQDLSGVVRVEGEVGHHVEGPGAHDGGDDDPHEHAGHPLPGIAGPAEAPLGVAESEPEGQRQSDAVGVDLEEPDVERDGDGSHGDGGLMVEGCPIRDATGAHSVCPRCPVG